MAYRLLADLTVLLHGLWIFFILGGLILSWRWPRLAWLHLGVLLLLLALNLGGWYCPLTHLEVWLRGQHDPALAYPGSFIANYLEKMIYLPVAEFWLRAAGVGWALLSLAGYFLLWRRRRVFPPGPERR